MSWTLRLSGSSWVVPGAGAGAAGVGRVPAELAHLVARLGRRLGAGRWRRHGRSGFGVRFLGGMSNTFRVAAAPGF